MFHGFGVQRYFRHHISTHVNLLPSNRNRIKHRAKQLTNWPWLTWVNYPPWNEHFRTWSHGWLEYFLVSFWGVSACFQVRFAVSFRVNYWSKFHPRIHVDSKNRFKSLGWFRFLGINLSDVAISQGKSFSDGPSMWGTANIYLPPLKMAYSIISFFF